METYEWHKYFCRSLFVIKNVEAIGSRDQFRFEEIIDSHISIHSLVVACSETSISWCFWIYTWTTCTLYFYGSIFTRLFGYMLNIALSFHHSPCKGPFEYNFLKTYCMSYLTLWMQSTNVIQKERPMCCWSERKKQQPIIHFLKAMQSQLRPAPLITEMKLLTQFHHNKSAYRSVV